MADTGRDYRAVRDAQLVAVALMRELADIALRAPPELAAELESIAALGHTCATESLNALDALGADASANSPTPLAHVQRALTP